ncbi:S66 peptidase family protein [Sphingobacterium wenxiniae]|uniref:Muramoyltetrapeptide carboxypeptidase n=1 Tax=Sphingobacterium wenxiniae TaxID=683125 RepID=A0A1I6QQ53_9SPHI|nr:LD-carboxypeptidase [Sphingobacterium wenxiniae]SFS54564.1 muramoyltetrapeptide carboxypeptidase [Sphingobacterium wenxiniae]
MDKRSFLKMFGLSMAALSTSGAFASFDTKQLSKPLLKPKVLKKGDTIGLITPAGPLHNEDHIAHSKELLEALGFKVKEGKYIRTQYGHLAGTDEERIEDLHAMFADPEVKGMLCVRGGNGASRLLDRLDYDLIRSNPKVLLGYSDITALIMAFYTKIGLVSFHGAVGNSQWSNRMARAFEEQFYDNKLQKFINPEDTADTIIPYNNRITTIHKGTAEGTLLGGNFTLITGLCGSEYLPDFKDAILFIEEIGENMSRLDRMFCQLKNTGILSSIKGFVFGHCTDCNPIPGEYSSLNLHQLFTDYIKPLGIPAFSGARIGHIRDQFILPVGVQVRMNADEGTIELLEQALL